MNHVTLVCYYILYFMLLLPHPCWHIQHGVSMLNLTWYQSNLLVAMVFCFCGIFKSNLCLSRCFFFVAFIFFGFLLLSSKLSSIVKPPLEVASILQDHFLPQTTITWPNSIQGNFSTLSNLKISSSFHLEFKRGC